jgi:hypothetical protein
MKVTGGVRDQIGEVGAALDHAAEDLQEVGRRDQEGDGMDELRHLGAGEDEAGQQAGRAKDLADLEAVGER